MVERINDKKVRKMNVVVVVQEYRYLNIVGNKVLVSIVGCTPSISFLHLFFRVCVVTYLEIFWQRIEKQRGNLDIKLWDKR